MKLALAAMKRGASEKYREKQEEDSQEMAEKDAFSEFAAFLAKGEEDKARKSLKAFIELCSEEY